MKKAPQYQALTAIHILSISIGAIYCCFGFLKFFHNYSPAEKLAIDTIDILTFHLLPKRFSLGMLAVAECAIGLLLLMRSWMKPVLVAMFVHMFFTFTPFLLFPQQTFGNLPHGLTLLGQYIMKNIVVLSAGWVLWQYFVKGGSSILVVPKMNEKENTQAAA